MKRLHLALLAGLALVATMPMVWAFWTFFVTPKPDVAFEFRAPVRAGETRSEAFILTYPETLVIQYRALKSNVRDEQRCEGRRGHFGQLQWLCLNARFAPALSWEVRAGGRVVAKGSRSGPLTSAQNDATESITTTTSEIVPRGTTRFEIFVTAHNDLAGLGARRARVIVASPPMLGESQAWLLFAAGVVVLFAVGVPLTALAGTPNWKTSRRR